MNPGYDIASDLVTLGTYLPGVNDLQQFCYDELGRLKWAGSTGTPTCTGIPMSGPESAPYTAVYNYDPLDRLIGGPTGSYTYGAAGPLHAATAIGAAYTAAYDAAGDMTCRAPQATATCAGGSPTGASLGYDAAGRLATWASQPTNPSATDAFLYDGAGDRVAQQATQNGTTSTTVYVGDLEAITTTGSSTTTTAYYYMAGQRFAEEVNGALSFLASDGLGSATEAFDASGNVQAQQLYAPYGAVRYSSGTMPTDYGFTGQRADAATGLDFFNARYYDPAAGQFASADTTLAGGLNRYAYVGDDPENNIDPDGHLRWPRTREEWQRIGRIVARTAWGIYQILHPPHDQPAAGTDEYGRYRGAREQRPPIVGAPAPGVTGPGGGGDDPLHPRQGGPEEVTIYDERGIPHTFIVIRTPGAQQPPNPTPPEGEQEQGPAPGTQPPDTQPKKPNTGEADARTQALIRLNSDLFGPEITFGQPSCFVVCSVYPNGGGTPGAGGTGPTVGGTGIPLGPSASSRHPTLFPIFAPLGIPFEPGPGQAGMQY